MRDIVPIADRATHVAEAGRLRMGEKHGRAMRALQHWRLTSPRRDLLEDAAALYGGTVKPWKEPKANPPDQFQLYTETATLDVAIVPNAFNAHYEEWGGGGILRRCDGVTCTQPTRVSDDDVEMIEVACICRAQQVAVCKPYTRLSVVLPNIRFAGVWRLETKSWNALDEIAAMEAMISQLQEHGITAAKLSIDKRKSVIAGKTHHYVVPVLWVDMTPEQIALGQASMTALAPASDRPALTTGTASPPRDTAQAPVGPPGVDRGPEDDWFAGDDEIVDAEIVDEDHGADDHARPVELKPKVDRMRSKLVILCNEKVPAGVDVDELRHAVAWKVSDGRTTSSKELTEDELGVALDKMEKAVAGGNALTGLVTEFMARPL